MFGLKRRGKKSRREFPSLRPFPWPFLSRDKVQQFYNSILPERGEEAREVAGVVAEEASLKSI